MHDPNGNKTYVIGLDFGTLSVRAVITSTDDGKIIGEAESIYPHGVMDKALSAGDGHQLPPDFALQVPSDYIESSIKSVSDALRNADIDHDRVVGIGLDVTSSTVIITDSQGTPVCERLEFFNEPHAYIKLWKHHGASSQAERITRLAQERNEFWLTRSGGAISAEMLLPKILETLECAPDAYQAADEVLDILDWLTWQFTGNLTYAAGDSGYKRIYQDNRYPSEEFLRLLNPDFGEVYKNKMSHPVVALGTRVGGLTKEFSSRFGLREGIAVAAGNIDAHVHAASVGAVNSGQLTGILGTSNCWVLPSEEYADVPGTFGVVDGGVCEGLWAFESGQSAVGDMFAWFVNTCVPQSYFDEAKDKGISIHALLSQRAATQEVGEHGLIALDWWNGNRSTLIDAELSGLIIGQTLATTAVDQYRALMEATAFGARVIIDGYEQHGVPVKEIRVAGGLLKNSFLMQTYADITHRPLYTATYAQAGAHGSSIFASVAAGVYPDLRSASDAMGSISNKVYEPNPEAIDAYDLLYEKYLHLYHLFGLHDPTMHDLRDIRRKALAKKAPL